VNVHFGRVRRRADWRTKGRRPVPQAKAVCPRPRRPRPRKGRSSTCGTGPRPCTGRGRTGPGAGALRQKPGRGRSKISRNTAVSFRSEYNTGLSGMQLLPRPSGLGSSPERTVKPFGQVALSRPPTACGGCSFFVDDESRRDELSRIEGPDQRLGGEGDRVGNLVFLDEIPEPAGVVSSTEKPMISTPPSLFSS